MLRLADEAVPYDVVELRDDDVELPERYDDELLRDDELFELFTLLLELLLLELLKVVLELFTLLFVFELFTVVLFPDERVVEVVPPDTRTELPTEMLLSDVLLLPLVLPLELPP